MSALTFESLSTELSDALQQQPHTPPKTTARCTLGRDKVMVLVEYPLDSVRAETQAIQVLDWLERHLRDQFDTTGLPDELAELTEADAEVVVQIYLKHLSESKPFKRRTFTWKVADSFDELFGSPEEAFESAFLANESMLGDEDLMAETGRAHSENGEASIFDELLTPTEAQPTSTMSVSEAGDLFSIDLPPEAKDVSPEEESQVLSELDEVHLSSDLEDEFDRVIDEEIDSDGSAFEAGEAELDNSTISAVDVTGRVFSINDFSVNGDVSDLDSQIDEPYETSGHQDDSRFVDSEAELEAALAEDAPVLPTVESEEFSLPGEAIPPTSDEFELPSVDFPAAVVTGATTGSFFDLDEPEDAIADVVDVDAVETADAEVIEVEASTAEMAVDSADSADGDLFSFGGEKAGDEQDEALAETVSSGTSDSDDFFNEQTTADDETDVVDDLVEDSVDNNSADDGPELVSETTLTVEETGDEDVLEAADGSADQLLSETTEVIEAVEDAASSDAIEVEETGTEDAIALEEASLTVGDADMEASGEDVELTGESTSESVSEDGDVDESEYIDEDESVVDVETVDEPESVVEDESDDDVEAVTTSEPALLEDTDSHEVDFAAAVDAQMNDYDVVQVDDKSSDLSSLDFDVPGLEGLSIDAPTVDELPPLEDDADAVDAGIDDDLEARLDLSGFMMDETDGLAEADPSEEELRERQGASAFVAPDVDTESETPEVPDDYLPDADDPAEYEYESEQYNSEEYANDPTYYLEGEAADEEPVYEDIAAIDEREVQRQREQWEKQTKGNPLFIVGAFGLLLASVVGFVLTRPCTIGSCPRLEESQQRGDDAIAGLMVGDVGLEEVQAAQQDLRRSIQALAPIPIWSPYYSEAQALLPEYERQISALDAVTEAQGLAYGAAVRSQDPPHPKSRWEEIADEWRKAIDALESVSPESPSRALADRKLIEYRANLSTILVRIDAEETSEANLNGAMQAAAQAQQTAETATSVEQWESALEGWREAVDRLRLIPQGTLAYGEAQGLLEDYEEKLLEVRQQTELERSSAATLARAKGLAVDAQRVEDDEQWTVSVDYLSTAIQQLQEIPEGTSARSEVAPLVERYTMALAEAEGNQRVSQRFAPIEPSFFLVCGAAGEQKCTYNIQRGDVRVNLFQGYDQVIEQSLTPPTGRVPLAVEPFVVAQGNQMLQQLSLLGAQVQIPIALYSSEGTFLARYRPDLDGFVKESAPDRVIELTEEGESGGVGELGE